MSSITYGNSSIIVAPTGEITMPFQSAFSAFLDADDPNVTGNTVAYTIGSATALTEVFDQNADFNVNGTFTAPVTGKYLSIINITLTAADGRRVDVTNVTSNRTYGSDIDLSNTESVFQGCVLADMDAADTSIWRIVATGGAQDVSLDGDANIPYTYEMTSLIC